MFPRTAKHNVSHQFDATLELTTNMISCLHELALSEDAIMRNDPAYALPFVSFSNDQYSVWDMKNSEFWTLVEHGWLIPMLEGDGCRYTLSYEARTVLDNAAKIFRK